MRPATVRVFGKEYRLEWDSEALDETDLLGDHSLQRLMVRIAKGLAPDEERETVLHEFTHAVEIHLGCSIPETKVRRLSVGIFAILRDNPKLLAYLFGDKK